jgi:hypothetical protein
MHKSLLKYVRKEHPTFSLNLVKAFTTCEKARLKASHKKIHAGFLLILFRDDSIPQFAKRTLRAWGRISLGGVMLATGGLFFLLDIHSISQIRVHQSAINFFRLR